MRYMLPISAVLILVLSTARAQMADLSSSPFSRNSLAHGGSGQQTIYLAGKVVSDDGSAVDESVTVVLQCGSGAQAQTHSDAKGSFSLTFVPEEAVFRQDILGQNGNVSSLSLTDCELHGELAGYRSEYVRLSGRPEVGVLQVGAIVMHPVSPDRNFSVSVTSLAAPEKAKKSLQKGREQAKKGKWAAAAGYFARAVEVYPRYALAWVELGRMQVKENRFAQAQQSFQRSVEQDSRFLDAYVGLAYLALQQRQWKELADTSERVVELVPNSAEFWFLNALAALNLGNTGQAESSVGRALRLDPKRQIPETEYLYGLILAARHDYGAAAEHVSAYLSLAPHSSNALAAQAALSEFQKNAQNSTSADR